MNIKNPESENFQALHPGNEIILTGEVIRTKLAVEGSPERIDWIIGHFQGKTIRIKVTGKLDIRQFLNPLDFSNTTIVRDRVTQAARDIVVPN